MRISLRNNKIDKGACFWKTGTLDQGPIDKPLVTSD